MIRDADRLRAFEGWYSRNRTSRRTYLEALEIFEALWAHARLLNRDFPSDWSEDIIDDYTLGRVLNGLPREA